MNASEIEQKHKQQIEELAKTMEELWQKIEKKFQQLRADFRNNLPPSFQEKFEQYKQAFNDKLTSRENALKVAQQKESEKLNQRDAIKGKLQQSGRGANRDCEK